MDLEQKCPEHLTSFIMIPLQKSFKHVIKHLSMSHHKIGESQRNHEDFEKLSFIQVLDMISK